MLCGILLSARNGNFIVGLRYFFSSGVTCGWHLLRCAQSPIFIGEFATARLAFV